MKINLKNNSIPQRLIRPFYFTSRRLKALYQHFSLPAENPSLSISYCTSVKNRFEFLQQTLPKNMDDCAGDAQVQFVVLNYNCPDPRTDQWIESSFQNEMATGRLIYAKIFDAPDFNFPHARNVCFRLATHELCCNVDADNFIGSGFSRFLRRAMSREGRFVHGPRDGRGLRGRIGFRKDDWLDIRGYDERFVGRLPEDRNLIDRLTLKGLISVEIADESFCRALQHSEASRYEFSAFDKKERVQKLEEWRKKVELRPNPQGFGKARVLKNFSEWIDLE